MILRRSTLWSYAGIVASVKLGTITYCLGSHEFQASTLVFVVEIYGMEFMFSSTGAEKFAAWKLSSGFIFRATERGAGGKLPQYHKLQGAS